MKMRGKPQAALIDMDGTLANVSGIRHYVRRPNRNFHRFHEASEFVPANREAIAFGKRQHKLGRKNLIVTARMRMWETATRNFLEREVAHHFPYEPTIYMREDGDHRKDVEIKRELFAAISEQYNVVAACDDNPSIIALWEELQIPEIVVVPGWEEESANAYAEAANRIK
ncbi:polynucleotide kinase [Mycobacterium phage ScoobyDoobyDoo]|nr:polynucleotide kinase [Mycobacterium phage ScoobyDoobyDoo]